MKKYQPQEIEQKWQKKWAKDGLYTSDLTKPNKFYCLAEFPYPSGDLHMGHWFTFGGADIFARFKRLQGYQVFFPNGFDAFGLPAENAAIKHNIHPKDWTIANIARMKEQFASMGASFTFDHEVVTCFPEYYKWNQWIFLRMLERGLAYRGKYLSNWCDICQTVLANEAVEGGACWRCGTEVIQKEVEQWFFKITGYAQRLIWSDPPPVNWPKALRDAQNSWIGRSEGVIIKFGDIEVFTTRPDTIFGATFLVLAPEHPLVLKLATKDQQRAITAYRKQSIKKSELDRKENKDKSGVFTGSFVLNPLTKEEIPVWVADYVLPGYGTGAIMAVPAHDARDFEFAKKHNLSIRQVVVAIDRVPRSLSPLAASYEDEGQLVNSGEFTGQSSPEARKNISDYIERNQLGRKMVYYHLHDWSISRQRYWGTPIPVIHCPKCGIVPVPDKDLPIELPYDVDYTPKGKPPLASNEAWLKVTCPQCGAEAQRDPDTMDTFVDSSWYFFRYLSPNLDSEPFEKELAKKIMPVNIYFGGAEHTLGHTLYSRFFTKFFHDSGLTDLEEYALRRVNHGIVLGPDGQKMSKSRGNVVNPDEEVKKYGADAVRVHLAFFMPYDGTGSWISERIWGSYRFLERVWEMFDKVGGEELSNTDKVHLNRTIQKVTNDIEAVKFNTAVAALMEWLNYLSRKNKAGKLEYQTLLLLLAPFAPHMAEELWQMAAQKESVHSQPWPKFDERYLEEEQVTIAVQVNGKVRGSIVVPREVIGNQQEVEKQSLASERIQKFLSGQPPKKVIYVQGKVLNLVV